MDFTNLNSHLAVCTDWYFVTKWPTFAPDGQNVDIVKCGKVTET